jgi:protein-disulfide isomerase-like protein with CxxC motif
MAKTKSDDLIAAVTEPDFTLHMGGLRIMAPVVPGVEVVMMVEGRRFAVRPGEHWDSEVVETVTAAQKATDDIARGLRAILIGKLDTSDPADRYIQVSPQAARRADEKIAVYERALNWYGNAVPGSITRDGGAVARGALKKGAVR